MGSALRSHWHSSVTSRNVKPGETKALLLGLGGDQVARSWVVSSSAALGALTKLACCSMLSLPCSAYFLLSDGIGSAICCQASGEGIRGDSSPRGWTRSQVRLPSEGRGVPHVTASMVAVTTLQSTEIRYVFLFFN